MGTVAGVYQNQLPVRRGLGLHAVQELLQNCGGVLYSGVRMLMVGQPSARAAASARWASSVCFDGRYRAFCRRTAA
ncbi:hypothetical protein NIA69_09605 [Gemmiger formicilis]|nr:hypothetical protein [Gemmiger formicilis]